MTLGLSQRGVRVDSLRLQPDLQRRVAAVFGGPDDPLEDLISRSELYLPHVPVVVWEADPLSFSFTYVSATAQPLLGYPSERWLQPGFWTGTLVHPEDVADAVAHCAMATAAGNDHDFEYRARTASGAEILLHDVVHVLKGPLGFAAGLRGLMFPVAGLR